MSANEKELFLSQQSWMLMMWWRQISKNIAMDSYEWEEFGEQRKCELLSIASQVTLTSNFK